MRGERKPVRAGDGTPRATVEAALRMFLVEFISGDVYDNLCGEINLLRSRGN